MTWRPGLRAFAVMAALPLVAVVAASLQMASQGRAAFKEMTETLGTLGRTTVLEQRIRTGVNRQLLAATRFLHDGNEEAWSDFTRLAWTVYEDEARYLALPLTPEERVAVERVRTQHRLFEGMAQAAMARRTGAAPAAELQQIQEAFHDVETAIEDVSRMIQDRVGAAAAAAGRSSTRIGLAAGALALLFGVALAVSSTLALRGVLSPLESLQSAAARLGQGDLSARAPVAGVPVVAELGRRFNSMAEDLEALLQRLEDRVEARTAQLAALESLSRAGLANLDRDALLRTVLERMSSAAGAEAASLRLIEDGHLVSLAHEGLPPEVVRAPLPLQEPTDRVLETHRAHWVEDLRDEKTAPALIELGFRATALVPLAVKDRSLGLVWLLFREPRPRDADLIRVLEAMATRAALGLERSEMVQQMLETADDLRRANQRLIETQQRLVQAERLAAVGQIQVTLRHEINNPLSVLTGASEILEQQADSPEVVRRWASHVAEATSRITQVLRRLEELRRVETTEYSAGVPMIDLGRAVEDKKRPRDE